MQCHGLAIGTPGAIPMVDNSIPIGGEVARMTYAELELETAVETITKRRADADRRRAELRIAEFVVPWWRRWFRW
jgi:hypothetical protein